MELWGVSKHILWNIIWTSLLFIPERAYDHSVLETVVKWLRGRVLRAFNGRFSTMLVSQRSVIYFFEHGGVVIHLISIRNLHSIVLDVEVRLISWYLAMYQFFHIVSHFLRKYSVLLFVFLKVQKCRLSIFSYLYRIVLRLRVLHCVCLFEGRRRPLTGLRLHHFEWVSVSLSFHVPQLELNLPCLNPIII